MWVLGVYLQQTGTWSHAKVGGVRGQQTATQFMGCDHGRIWTGSRCREAPRSHGNSALCGSSASRRGSFPGAPFCPGERRHRGGQWCATVRFRFFPSMRFQHRQKHTAINKYHLCLPRPTASTNMSKCWLTYKTIDCLTDQTNSKYTLHSALLRGTVVQSSHESPARKTKFFYHIVAQM